MDKKSKLIKTAIKLFVKQGFENTPTSQISKDAGVASGTLFYYYKSKEDLVKEAYISIKLDMAKSLAQDFNKDEDIKNNS